MNKRIRNSTAEYLIFTSQTSEGSIEVRVEDDTVWLTQKLIAELFGIDVRTVSKYLQNIFKDGELQEGSVIRKFRNTTSDGKNYRIVQDRLFKSDFDKLLEQQENAVKQDKEPKK